MPDELAQLIARIWSPAPAQQPVPDPSDAGAGIVHSAWPHWWCCRTTLGTCPGCAQHPPGLRRSLAPKSTPSVSLICCPVPYSRLHAERVLQAFLFGPFRVIPYARLLERGVSPVLLGGRAFDFLCLLIICPGEVVSKGDPMARAWPNVTVEGSNLRAQINVLRRALGVTANEVCASGDRP